MAPQGYVSHEPWGVRRSDLVHLTPLFLFYAKFKPFFPTQRSYAHYISMLYFQATKYMEKIPLLQISPIFVVRFGWTVLVRGGVVPNTIPVASTEKSEGGLGLGLGLQC